MRVRAISGCDGACYSCLPREPSAGAHSFGSLIAAAEERASNDVFFPRTDQLAPVRPAGRPFCAGVQCSSTHGATLSIRRLGDRGWCAARDSGPCAHEWPIVHRPNSRIATATCTSPCWVYARMCLRCTAQGCRLVDLSDRSGTDVLSGKGAPRRLRGHSEMLQPGPRVHRCLGIWRERAPSS